VSFFALEVVVAFSADHRPFGPRINATEARRFVARVAVHKDEDSAQFRSRAAATRGAERRCRRCACSSTEPRPIDVERYVLDGVELDVVELVEALAAASTDRSPTPCR